MLLHIPECYNGIKIKPRVGVSLSNNGGVLRKEHSQQAGWQAVEKEAEEYAHFVYI